MAVHARLRPLVVGALLLGCGSDKPPEKVDAPREGEAGKADEADGGPSATSLGDAPLANGQPSLEALGKAVVAALAAKDGKALLGLSVSQGEFERRLFGTLVSDPQERKGGPRPAWKRRSSESLRAMGSALSEHGGTGYAFVSLASTRKQERSGLVVHESPTHTVKDGSGTVRTLPILGEVIEHPASGTFLVLSFAG